MMEIKCRWLAISLLIVLFLTFWFCAHFEMWSTEDLSLDESFVTDGEFDPAVDMFESLQIDIITQLDDKPYNIYSTSSQPTSDEAYYTDSYDDWSTQSTTQDFSDWWNKFTDGQSTTDYPDTTIGWLTDEDKESYVNDGIDYADQSLLAKLLITRKSLDLYSTGSVTPRSYITDGNNNGGLSTQSTSYADKTFTTGNVENQDYSRDTGADINDDKLNLNYPTTVDDWVSKTIMRQDGYSSSTSVSGKQNSQIYGNIIEEGSVSYENVQPSESYISGNGFAEGSFTNENKQPSENYISGNGFAEGSFTNGNEQPYENYISGNGFAEGSFTNGNEQPIVNYISGNGFAEGSFTNENVQPSENDISGNAFGEGSFTNENEQPIVNYISGNGFEEGSFTNENEQPYENDISGNAFGEGSFTNENEQPIVNYISGNGFGEGSFTNENEQPYENDISGNAFGEGSFTNENEQPIVNYISGNGFGEGSFTNENEQPYENDISGNAFGEGSFTNENEQPIVNYISGNGFGEGSFTNENEQPSENYISGNGFAEGSFTNGNEQPSENYISGNGFGEGYLTKETVQFPDSNFYEEINEGSETIEKEQLPYNSISVKVEATEINYWPENSTNEGVPQNKDENNPYGVMASKEEVISENTAKGDPMVLEQGHSPDEGFISSVDTGSEYKETEKDTPADTNDLTTTQVHNLTSTTNPIDSI